MKDGSEPQRLADEWVGVKRALFVISRHFTQSSFVDLSLLYLNETPSQTEDEVKTLHFLEIKNIVKTEKIN